MMDMCAHDREVLVAEMRDRGIRFLAPGDAKLGVARLSDKELLLHLAQHQDPRLRFALIPWFILNPAVHVLMPLVVQELPAAARVELKALYTAAVYLQRLWWTRLRFYLDNFEELPDEFSSELELPPATERHGKAGLHALADWHARQSDYPVNRLASYNRMIDLLFRQLIQETRKRAA
ncbi:MAG: hypothetical protein ACE5HA_08390 [Anaerolineae bacterium]